MSPNCGVNGRSFEVLNYFLITYFTFTGVLAIFVFQF